MNRPRDRVDAHNRSEGGRKSKRDALKNISALSSKKPGPTQDLARVFAAAQAVAIFQFTMRKNPRTSDISSILGVLIKDSGEWTTARIKPLLEQSQDAGLVRCVGKNPYTWDAMPLNIEMNNLTFYLVSRIDSPE